MYIILHTLYICHRAIIRHDLTHTVLYTIKNDSSVMETNKYNVVHDVRVHDNPLPLFGKKMRHSPPPPLKKQHCETVSSNALP